MTAASQSVAQSYDSAAASDAAPSASEARPHTAMIMAAGRGERMRHLTDITPKPMLKVAGRPLIDWVIDRLQTFGIGRIVVNTSYLGD
ncbi:MAG: NTP transferase domain-containing protein, partial [Pseudomonadota bacterium]